VAFTLVSFHAHPDDEALLTGGTLARAAAQGHRVVLVAATDGGSGLAADRFGHGEQLASTRLAELDRAAKALCAARVAWLGYADSGMGGTADGDTFVRADPEEAAQRLAAILREENAHVLTGYDQAGGYGHPDHVRVHQVARRAADLAGTPVLLEATVDRDLLLRAVSWGRRLRLLPDELSPAGFAQAYTPRAQLTHQIDVRPWLPAKRAALQAHSSQATGSSTRDDDSRTIAALLRLPGPLARRVLGREWFVERGRSPGMHPRGRHPAPLLEDLFATLRR
jgi:LmbE family N-acetylglucosaminyl deacetylase